MVDLKHLVFRTGLSALSMTGAARLMAGRTRGCGAVLMFHNVRPHKAQSFDPHRILEITPEYLDAVLTHVKTRGYDIIPLDALPDRMTSKGRPFVVLTFDDGYRDNVEFALPVLRKHNAPFTVFATTGFAEATAPLWWLDLEDAIRVLPEVRFDGQAFPLTNDAERWQAFKTIYGALRTRPEPAMSDFIADLAKQAGVDNLQRTAELCLDWDGLRALNTDPLCTIGAHTLTHPLLGPQSADFARHEVVRSREILQEKLQRPIKHLAYPVGDPVAAGQREFAVARELGFATAVTTRPGVVFPAHIDHIHALPRLSVNGLYQSIADFDVLLSGAAFWLFNRGRALNVS
ncbi:MAG: polysaccharide deacetylase family protein [Beijerinckiaceae bacterium]